MASSKKTAAGCGNIRNKIIRRGGKGNKKSASEIQNNLNLKSG